MRLATLNDGSRDGELIVVSRSGARYVSARDVAPTLQCALDTWRDVEKPLRALAQSVETEANATPLRLENLLAPLPRAFEWLDGSLYLNHVELVRKARGASVPDVIRREPLVYQGGSGVMLPAHTSFELPDAAWGLDFEAEVCVVLNDTPRNTSASAARDKILLLMLANDWSYRNLIPKELEKGFGFVISKPATAFSPFAVTPDEFGEAFDGERLHLKLRSYRNGEQVGAAETGEGMHFSFCELIAHLCRTRGFVAGTIVGSGTVSNREAERGVSCIAEQRTREVLQRGEAFTPYLSPGETVRIEALDAHGWNVFGSIEQSVVSSSEVNQ